jgi:hypothetical protein
MLIQVMRKLHSGTKIFETRPTMTLERNSGRRTVEEWRRRQGENKRALYGRISMERERV